MILINVPPGAFVSRKKNRPLLVTVKELEMRDTIISNLKKKLRDPIEKFRGAGISPDLHPRNEKT